MAHVVVQKARRGRNSRRLFLLAAVAVALAAVVGCGGKAPTKTPTPRVKWAAAKKMDMPLELTTIGVVTPLRSVALRAQVGAYVSRVTVEEGQAVSEGQLLFQLDTRTFDAQADVAAGTLAQTRAQLVNADLELKRGAELLKNKFISQQDFDTLQANADALRAGLAAQSAALERARLDQRFTTIRAPFAGRVGVLAVHTGDLVKVNDTTLVTLNEMKPMDVQFSVPEKQLPIVRDAQRGGNALRVEAKMAVTGEMVVGALNFVDNQVDARTGSVLLKARFANENEQLWPGQYVDITLRLGTRPGAVIIPAVAVQTGQQGQYLWVLDGANKVENRKVAVGPTRHGLTIVESGLTDGETIAVDGFVRLTPGVVVEKDAKETPVEESTS